MLTTLLGSLLALGIGLLGIPVHLVYALRKEDGWMGRAHLYWMFGLVRIRLRRRGGALARRRRWQRRWRTAEVLRRGTHRHRRRLGALLRSPGFLPRLIRFLRDLFRATRPRRFRARLVIGMEDPAATGYLAAALGPLRLLLARRGVAEPRAVSVEITPDFSGARLQGYSCASLGFIPLRLMGLCIGFALSPVVLRALRRLAIQPGRSARV